MKLSFFGGSGSEWGNQVGFDGAGNVYVTALAGPTAPTTPGAFDTSNNGGNDVWVGKFDANLTTLIYGTFLGGPGADNPWGMAVDAAGNVYLSGSAASGFPTTLGAYDTTYNGGTADIFIAKLDPTGGSLLYASYLGGSLSDNAESLVLDILGNVYITGYTYSSDFPITPGAYDTSLGGTFDAFVAKLTMASSGTNDLIFSTYLGGVGYEEGWALTVDGLGLSYVTGATSSADFPTTPGAFDTSQGSSSNWDAFVTKLNPSGTGLVYSTYLGGSGFDKAWGIALDGTGQAHVTGSTESPNFPATPGAFDTTRNSRDAFVTKFNAAGSGLVYSTFLGGKASEWGYKLVVADDGTAYVLGVTTSSNFPTTADGYDVGFNGVQDTFLTRLNAAGNGLVYSTYLGGSAAEEHFWGGLAVDDVGRVFIAGRTSSSNFPTSTDAYDRTYGGSGDGFIAALD